MALLEPFKPEQEVAERQIQFREGLFAEYRHIGKPVPNTIRNQKYSILSFVPLVLFKEFQYFFNLFYLFTAISQFIPALKVGLLFSFLAPLILVMFLTMVKEAYQDYHRYKKDKQINSATFRYLDINVAKLRVGPLNRLLLRNCRWGIWCRWQWEIAFLLIVF